MNTIAPRNSAKWQHSQSVFPQQPAEFTLQNAPKSPLIVSLLAFYVFLLTSRALDISRFALLHIPMILLACLTIGMLAKGDLKYALRSRVTVALLAFNFWVCVCFPFSSWRGGSRPFVIESIESLLVYLLIVQLVRTLRDWRRIANAYALGALGAAILSFFFGQSIEGRVSVVAGSLADPNEFALRLVLGLPFWWYLVSQSGAIGKIVSFLLTAPILISFARAGSRSGLLALMTLSVMMFFFVNIKQKALMCALAVVALAGGIAFLPSYLKVRFTTLFAKRDAAQLTQEERERLGGDIGSSEGREMLLWQGMRMTAEHPILGIGPGVFADVAWNERKEVSGVGGGLLVSHNTYTQLSSELGIPGFLFFVTALFLSIKHALQDYRNTRERDPPLARGSLYVFVCFIGLTVGIFFLSVGYGMLLAIMFGLASSLHETIKSETARLSSAAEDTQPELMDGSIAQPTGRQAAPHRSRKNRLNGRRVRFGRFVGAERSSSRPPLH